jgi:hypothetical protein
VRVGRAGRIAVGLAGAIVLALVLAQLLLPRIAASRISSRVGRYGSVQSVHVSAWPALKLLWGDADSVKVRASALSASPAQSSKLLWEARGVNELELTASSARVGPLRLSDVTLHKHGAALRAEGLVSEADAEAALPDGFAVQLLGSEQGEVEVRAGGALFGIGASVDAAASASDGKLIVRPRGLLIEGLTLTLFADPHVYVLGVSASRANGSGGEPGYRLGMTARLR